MTKPLAYGTLLLLTTTFVTPAALAQGTGQAATPPAQTTVAPSPAEPQQPETGPGQRSAQELANQDNVEVSAPGVDADAGEDIVVIGRNIPNVIRSTPQVLSVLSSADIARSGEGDIAGALTRVTGLSVVGNGFVFVRGLGDRYSSSLLNGSPLPSPDPLRRTVPLDIFPTTIVASSLVQKSYSVNYPGEFGGGVINLTTRAVPKESFLQLGGGITFDTFTTSNLGYVYDGGDSDWIGYDDGTRDVPNFIRDAGANNVPAIGSQQVTQLTNSKVNLLQRNDHIPANFNGELSFGHGVDVGSGRVGIIASGSVSNSWRTRDAIQQDTTDTDGALRSDFRTVLTDNRIVANGLIGLGAELGEQKIRWTNVYIHDTLKQGRLSTATVYPNSSGDPIVRQNTNWFERQLFDTQLTGELKFGDLNVDVRGSYANTKRDAPYESAFSYICSPLAAGSTVTGSTCENNGRPGVYRNDLNGLGQSATVAFSELDEDLWSGQADLRYEVPFDRPVTLNAGYFYSDTNRTSSRYDFRYRTFNRAGLTGPASYLRPDLLLGEDSVLGGCVNPDPEGGCIELVNTTGSEGAGLYEGSLRIHAGYFQVESEIADGLRVTSGVRFEDADERVTTSAGFAGTTLSNSYWLPAITATWNFAEDMQLRLHASKTIARPQFRELAPQLYRDFESDRLFFGNPALVDTELMNYEARYEYFFGRDERFTIAGFYKDLTNATEQVAFFPNNEAPLQTTFSYVPSAQLYGGEVELQKHFPLASLGAGFETRRILVVANYTYTQSELNADDTLVPNPIQNSSGVVSLLPASQVFRDGARLTGQSDHLVNLQLGIEDTERTSQLTVLFNYASERVTNRGPNLLPDIVERPGIRLDVVARQGIPIGNDKQVELKFEGRNLTRTKYQEYQEFDGDRVFVNRYNLGSIYSVGLSVRL